MSDLTVIDLDLRGKACPGPVVETRRAFLRLDKETKEVIISVKLDNQAACANVARFAESQNFMVSQEADAEGIFTLTITRGFSCELPLPDSSDSPNSPDSPAPEPPNRYIVYIDSSNMGRGDEKLGRILMKAFLRV